MIKHIIRRLALTAAAVGLCGFEYGASLTGAEIAQIQSAPGVTLSSNDVTQRSSIVYPTNRPTWRSTAYAHIEMNRKADIDIRGGKTVPDTAGALGTLSAVPSSRNPASLASEVMKFIPGKRHETV